MTRLGGPAGLPFFAFLDGQGALIVNSMRPGEGLESPAGTSAIPLTVSRSIGS